MRDGSGYAIRLDRRSCLSIGAENVGSPWERQRATHAELHEQVTSRHDIQEI
jgi:hypothetical protein